MCKSANATRRSGIPASAVPLWTVSANCTRDVAPSARQGRLTDAVSVTFPAECYRDAMQERITGLTVVLTLEDGTRNHYPIWLIPRVDICITREGIGEGRADGGVCIRRREGGRRGDCCAERGSSFRRNTARISGATRCSVQSARHGQACAGRDDGAVHRHRVAAAEAVRAGGLPPPRGTLSCKRRMCSAFRRTFTPRCR